MENNTLISIKKNLRSINTNLYANTEHSPLTPKGNPQEQEIIFSLFIKALCQKHQQLSKDVLFTGSLIDSFKALFSNTYSEKWSSGILPCKLMEALKEDFKYMEDPHSMNDMLSNLAAYVEGCKSLGLVGHQIPKVDDLYQCGDKGMILHHLIQIAKYSQKLKFDSISKLENIVNINIASMVQQSFEKSGDIGPVEISQYNTHTEGISRKPNKESPLIPLKRTKKEDAKKTQPTKVKESDKLLPSLIDGFLQLHQIITIFGYNPSTFNTDDKYAIQFKRKMQFNKAEIAEVSHISESLKLYFRKIKQLLKLVPTYKAEELHKRLSDDGGILIFEEQENIKQKSQLCHESTETEHFAQASEFTQMDAVKMEIESEDDDDDSDEGKDGIPKKEEAPKVQLLNANSSADEGNKL